MDYDATNLWRAERSQRKQIMTRTLAISGVFVILLLISVALLDDWSDGINVTSLGTLGGMLMCILAAWALTRADRLEWAAHLSYLSLIALVFVNAMPAGVGSRTVLGLVIPIVGAALFLPSRWCYGYAAIAVAVYIALSVIHPGPTANYSGLLIFNTVISSACFGITATFASLAAGRLSALLQTSIQHGEALEASRAELERRVEERTAGLQQALEELKASGETIRQLSAPILPIAEGVLVLPLIGNISAERAEHLSRHLLETVHRQRAHTVLFDMTAIGIADVQTTLALGQVTMAVRMLGAEPVLVGVRADTAETMVERGLNMSQIKTRRDVQSGLSYAMRRNHEDG